MDEDLANLNFCESVLELAEGFENEQYVNKVAMLVNEGKLDDLYDLYVQMSNELISGGVSSWN